MTEPIVLDWKKIGESRLESVRFWTEQAIYNATRKHKTPAANKRDAKRCMRCAISAIEAIAENSQD